MREIEQGAMTRMLWMRTECWPMSDVWPDLHLKELRVKGTRDLYIGMIPIEHRSRNVTYRTETSLFESNIAIYEF